MLSSKKRNSSPLTCRIRSIRSEPEILGERIDDQLAAVGRCAARILEDQVNVGAYFFGMRRPYANSASVVLYQQDIFHLFLFVPPWG
jgi:hypothetical protein